MATVEYYFNSVSAVEYWQFNSANMKDGNENTYSSEKINHDVSLLTANTCDGTNLGTITKVEIRAKTCYISTLGTGTVLLRPVFAGGDGTDHDCLSPPDTGAWSQWFDITTDTNAPSPWTWGAVKGLDCDVETDIGAGMGIYVYCSKVDIRVTYTPTPPYIPRPTAAVGNPLIF